MKRLSLHMAPHTVVILMACLNQFEATITPFMIPDVVCMAKTKE